MIEKEVSNRLERFNGMTAEEEGALLSLSADQKQTIAANDKKAKNEFLGAAPQISHGSVKMNDKYKNYIAMAQAASR